MNDQVMLEWLRKIAVVGTRDELKEVSERLKQLNLIASETTEVMHVYPAGPAGSPFRTPPKTPAWSHRYKAPPPSDYAAP